jgi:hypothetical protein
MEQLYDSDLNSENDPEKMESDHEPPKENKNDKKILRKTKTLKIYKHILQVGEVIARPAPFDEIQYRILKVQDLEEARKGYEKLLTQEIQKTNLGMNTLPEWFDIGLQNMRKNEIATIQAKKIKQDNDDTLKKYQRSEFHQIHLIDWVTIIDMDQDKNYMKKVLQKGEGQDRVSVLDEITFWYSINQGEVELVPKKEYIKHQILKEEEFPEVVMKLLKSMKPGDECECTIYLDEYIHREKPADADKLKERGGNIILKVKVDDLVKIDDIFDDGKVQKRLMIKGSSTAKADNNSEAFFNYSIANLKTGDTLYKSYNTEKLPEFTEDELNSMDFLRSASTKGDCVHLYLDEYKISRMLRQTLKRMKKNEVSDAVVKGNGYIKYGLDYDALVKANAPVTPESELKYTIIMYNFTEDRSGFTMNVKEKLFHGQRKKEIALQQYKNGHLKRAQKVFETINSYFDLGTFTDDERNDVKQIQLSSLLNTSLIQMKLNKFKELLMVSDKILKLDPNNVKAIYRKALCLRHAQDYDQAIALINNFKENLEKDPELKAKVDASFLVDMDQLLGTITLAASEYLKKQKQVYKSMFQ